jgi:hypothetical protein
MQTPLGANTKTKLYLMHDTNTSSTFTKLVATAVHIPRVHYRTEHSHQTEV